MARIPYTCPYRLVWALFDRDPSPAARMHRHYAVLIWRMGSWRIRGKLVLSFLFWWVSTAWFAGSLLWRIGGKVKRATGKPRWAQLAEMLYVDVRYSIAPDFYYKYELFKPERLGDAKHYLMRYEFKGGWHKIVEIAESLKAERVEPTSGQIINDKTLFGLHCRDAGLRAAMPLLKIHADHRIEWLDFAGPGLPEQDLFCKPNKSKGGRGCERWRFVGDNLYSDGVRELRVGDLVEHLASRARHFGPYVVQACLQNHPAIEDLGRGTFTTCRFLSLRNEHGEIEITHAMFKLALGKNAVVDNFHQGGSVAAVDLATGRLGPASDSGLREPCRWLTHHPATGNPIEGRILPLWEETVDLVRRAHRRFGDRVMIGWDVGFTADGPCIVEGNVQSATDMVQRTHAEPAGAGRLAEIFAYHLDRAPVAARHGRKFKLVNGTWQPGGIAAALPRRPVPRPALIPATTAHPIECPMLKEKLTRTGRCIGAWILGASADNVEAMAMAGLDFVVLDHEHGQGTLGDAVSQLRALKGTDCAGIVRVPSNDRIYIKRVLDAGAAGIMVPNIGSAKEARDVVAACRYPPEGVRGAFGGMRAMDYGFNADYYATAAERIFVAVQVESPAAIDRIDEIADVDGIDLIFIGPRDLSASMGKLNRFDDPAFAHEMARAERAILGSGKPLGSTAPNGGIAAGMFERGYSFVIAGSDMTLLGAGVTAMVSAARVTAATAAETAAPAHAASVAARPLAAPVMPRANTSIRRMRQFWFAWCVAVLLLGAAVVGFGYLLALSETWSLWAKIGGRLAAGLLAALAVYDAYRIATRGTAALQEVLAQNLASIVVAELERLNAAAVQRKLALASKDEPTTLGLALASWSFDGEDVRNLLGNPTEQALRDVLASIEAYNRMIDTLPSDDSQAKTSLARQIEEISAGVNRAMASVSGRLDDYRHSAGTG